MCVICVSCQRTLTHTETQSIYGLIVMPFIIFTPTHNCMVGTFGKCTETKAYHWYWDNIIFGILRHRHGHQHIFAMLRVCCVCCRKGNRNGYVCMAELVSLQIITIHHTLFVMYVLYVLKWLYLYFIKNLPFHQNRCHHCDSSDGEWRRAKWWLHSDYTYITANYVYNTPFDDAVALLFSTRATQAYCVDDAF